MKNPTFYRTVRVDGTSIFYREAGPKDAPTLLLLHGLPSSPRMLCLELGPVVAVDVCHASGSSGRAACCRQPTRTTLVAL
ncbi:MAG TPA: hypothetical protein VHW01_06945 [Polyangiaceae bacterium]|jgi:pimeloyl-ACP methyl ester carboxylesterase|nr:hypothetical protein [Polyangiaceae bacterium]